MLKKLGLLILFSLVGQVHAGVVISDIRMDVVGTHYVYNGGGIHAATQAMDNGMPKCSRSLSEINTVGARDCHVYRNYGQSIAFDIQTDENVWIQFGTDWGRGGLIFDSAGNHTDVLGDTWWGYNYNSGDIIDYHTGVIDTRLTFLGFEGCCGGATSARYSTDNGASWQTLASTPVPEPGAITLVALLGGLALIARRRVRD